MCSQLCSHSAKFSPFISEPVFEKPLAPNQRRGSVTKWTANFLWVWGPPELIFRESPITKICPHAKLFPLWCKCCKANCLMQSSQHVALCIVPQGKIKKWFKVANKQLLSGKCRIQRETFISSQKQAAQIIQTFKCSITSAGSHVTASIVQASNSTLSLLLRYRHKEPLIPQATEIKRTPTISTIWKQFQYWAHAG